ncbi:MAG: hypothetical protein CM1200mP27_08280 [Chloroflexota bacterium]|nr:MAG: hypothetical protein CM1200mP27_08280 [Chloroflexota bacterium]
MAHQGGIPDKTYLSGDSTHGGMSALQYSGRSRFLKDRGAFTCLQGLSHFQQLEALVIG